MTNTTAMHDCRKVAPRLSTFRACTTSRKRLNLAAQAGMEGGAVQQPMVDLAHQLADAAAGITTRYFRYGTLYILSKHAPWPQA